MARVVWDKAALDRLSRDLPVRMVDAAAAKTATRAKANIARKNRIRTGEMRRSIRTLSRTRTATSATVTVGSDVRYAAWQERGVKGPILPKRGRYLRFLPKYGKRFVYARSTRGFPGARFMGDALDTLKPSDFRPR